MEFETERICLNQLVESRKEDFSVEDNIIIPDVKPDILSTINSSGNVYLYKKELSNGKLRLDGGILVNIMYVSDDESGTRGLNTIVDFSKSFDIVNIEDEYDCECKVSIKDIECKILNGRKININVNLNADIKLYSNNEFNIIQSSGELSRAQMISKSYMINSLKGKGETLSIAKDTISLEKQIADILDTTISVKNKDIKISYNKVLSKADVLLEIMYTLEDGSIDVSSVSIPIMGFIDITGVSDDDTCITDYEVKNINIKPNSVDQDSINVEIEYVIYCRAYESKEINIIEDIYSPEEDIRVKQENVDIIKNKRIIRDMINVKNTLNIPDIANSKVYMIKLNPSITKKDISSSRLTVNGEMDVQVFFYSNLSNQMETRYEKIPFSYETKLDVLDKNNIADIDIEIASKSIDIMPDSRCGINVEMNLLIDTCGKESVNIVSDVDIQPVASDVRSSSLVIYYVKKGDTLWKIAKRFRSTVEEIMNVNNIENPDKLSIGEQLFIPKYVHARIS